MDFFQYKLFTFRLDQMKLSSSIRGSIDTVWQNTKDSCNIQRGRQRPEYIAFLHFYSSPPFTLRYKTDNTLVYFVVSSILLFQSIKKTLLLVLLHFFLNL